MKKVKEKLVLLGQGWFGVTNPFGGSSFTTYEGTVGRAQLLINTAVSLSALVAVAIVIFGGYMIITSAGDAEKVEQGNKAVSNGIIGLIIVFLAGTIIRFLAETLL